MKRVLIISFHSLPFDVIASYRANAYWKHFKKFGLEPVLLTHYLGLKAEEWVSIEKKKNGTIIRVPIKNHRISLFLSFFEALPFLNKISIVLRWLMGFLDASPKSIDSYLSLKSFCKQYLTNNHVDVVLGIFSPHHHLKLCRWINKKHSIPYVLDFRDLWHNRIMNRDYRPSFTEYVQDKTTEYYWKRWLKNALFFTITSDSWKDKLSEFSTTEGYTVNNGFDMEDYYNKNNEGDTGHFTILYTGSLYSSQRIEVFLKGYNKFINDENPTNTTVVFLGSDRKKNTERSYGSYMHDPKSYIKSEINESHVKVTNRVSKNEVIQQLQKAQLLLFLSHPDIPGWHSGKLFDYLGAQKNILMVPDDHGEVGSVIRTTKSGIIANTSEDVRNYLNVAYKEWSEKGKLNFIGDVDKINEFSRENQVKKMAQLLMEVV